MSCSKADQRNHKSSVLGQILSTTRITSYNVCYTKLLRLHIKIYIENNELIVENNKQKKEVLQDRKGVGLQNIVNRYAILTERKVAVYETDEVFRIKLPILTKQVNIMQTIETYNEDMAYIRAKDRVKKIKEFYSSLISYCIVIPGGCERVVGRVAIPAARVVVGRRVWQP